MATSWAILYVRWEIWGGGVKKWREKRGGSDICWWPALCQTRPGAEAMLSRDIARGSPVGHTPNTCVWKLFFFIIPGAFTYILFVNPHCDPVNRYMLLSHFVFEETEAQWSWVNGPGSHIQWVAGLGLESCDSTTCTAPAPWCLIPIRCPYWAL